MALSLRDQTLVDLELLGITSMYIAMKNEEVELINCRRFLLYTKTTKFEEMDVVRKER